VRLELERTIEMRAADQVAQVLPAGLVLGIERQVVDRPLGLRATPSSVPTIGWTPSALHAAAKAELP
jgi:hypothetical protein